MNHSISPAIGGRLRRGGWRLGLGALAVTALALGTVSAASAASAVDNAPIGHLDSVTAKAQTITVQGWAADPDAPNNSIAVRAVFTPNMLPTSNNYVTNIAHDPRPDVVVAHPELGPNHGFSFTIETYKAGPTTLCLFGVDLKNGPDGPLGCKRIVIAQNRPAIGHLDSVTAVGNGHVEIRGWAADQDTPDAADSVNVLLGGATSTKYYNAIPLKANLARPDVATAYPALGPNHGFDITVAAKAGRYPICASAFDTAINHYGGSSIGCITVTV